MKVKFVERAPAHVACLRHTGPYGAPFERFRQQTVAPWLAENGLLHARPCFEFYPKGAKMDPKTGAFECQIVVPVASL